MSKTHGRDGQSTQDPGRANRSTGRMILWGAVAFVVWALLLGVLGYGVGTWLETWDADVMVIEGKGGGEP